MDIPKQLKKEGFRFNLLKEKDKIPIEEWRDINYKFNDPKLLFHKGNYGVLCGGGLIVMDADTKEFDELITKNFGETFTVQSKKGKHYYFYCQGFDRKRVLKKDGLHLGEIQSTGTFVVGASSIHPSGVTYLVCNDAPILDVAKERVDYIFKEFYSTEKIDKEIITTGTNEGLRNDSLFRIACSFREKGLTIDETLATLSTLNKNNKPPLSHHELKQISRSAYSYEKTSEKEITPLSTIKQDVHAKLLMKQPRQATEIVTNHILDKDHIYTTRDDEHSDMWIYKEGIYVPEGRTYIKEMCRDIFEEGYTNHLGNEVINKIEAETFVEQDKFFTKPKLNHIAVQNGILDIVSKELLPFTPKEIHFNKLPVTYDSNKDCPFIKKHLETVLQNKKDVPVLQELFGYLLYKEYKIEKAFMFTGSGRNGKGKTLELMKRFVGIDNCSNIPLQQIEKDNFALGEFFNKLANLGGDIAHTALKDTGHFKNLTGRDLVSAARKFKTRVNFTNYAKMIFCANELPITYDITTAFFNRWILLEFPYTFLSQKEIDVLLEDEKTNVKLADPEIIDKLSTKGELSGLLNWALEGLERLFKQGDFSYSPSTKEVREKWVRMSDSAAAFLMDNVVEEWDSYIPKAELRQRYSKYCKEHKIKPVGDKTLKNALIINFGATDERKSVEGDMQSCWMGVRFKDGAAKVENVQL